MGLCDFKQQVGWEQGLSPVVGRRRRQQSQTLGFQRRVVSPKGWRRLALALGAAAAVGEG